MLHQTLKERQIAQNVELAAKALGLDVVEMHPTQGAVVAGLETYWHPGNRQEQADELIDRLGITLNYNDGEIPTVTATHPLLPRGLWEFTKVEGKEAATRAVVLRVAAEVGKIIQA